MHGKRVGYLFSRGWPLLAVIGNLLSQFPGHEGRSDKYPFEELGKRLRYYVTEMGMSVGFITIPYLGPTQTIAFPEEGFHVFHKREHVSQNPQPPRSHRARTRAPVHPCVHALTNSRTHNRTTHNTYSSFVSPFMHCKVSHQKSHGIIKITPSIIVSTLKRATMAEGQHSQKQQQSQPQQAAHWVVQTPENQSKARTLGTLKKQELFDGRRDPNQPTKDNCETHEKTRRSWQRECKCWATRVLSFRCFRTDKLPVSPVERSRLESGRPADPETRRCRHLARHGALAELQRTSEVAYCFWLKPFWLKVLWLKDSSFA